MSAQHQRQPRRKSLEALRRILRRPHRFSRNKVLPAAAPSPKGEESKELGGTGDISGAVNILLGDSGAAVAPAPATVTPTAAAAPSAPLTPSAPLRVGYLCAEPLVWRSSSDGSLKALPPVQRHQGGELALLKTVLGRAPARVRLRAEPCATVAALRSLLTAGCDVVHYTGHGVRGALTFELEGRAELDVCTEETLGRLVAAGGHRTKVVFLAACDSERPGKALARMGIPHVVCVRAGARLSDRTARSFAEQFYDALCRGETVKQAFDIATAVDEKGAYLLLPAGACYKHDTVLCDATEESQTNTITTPRLCPVRGPAPPERLAGRNDAVAEVVRLIGFERRRCVTVRGARGVGKTAVARAAAAFLADRGNLDVVCEVALGDVQTNASYEDYFGLSPARRDDAVQRRIEGRLVTVLADALEALSGSPRPVTARRVQDRTAITESPDALAKALASERRCLLVADGVTAENRVAVRRIATRLLAAAPALSVVTTGRVELSAGDLGERVVDLGPLGAASMAELLTELAPRRLSSAEMLDGGDASPYSPGAALSFDRPFSPPAALLGGDVRAFKAFGRHPAVQALRGNCAAAVKFAPELKRPLRHHQALAAAARAAVVEADNEASVGSSWDWACRAMSA
mmetsp:Transcript_7289/g.18990  ORF Transcript_7289/g.18990 Transcript_7289/m.18990 type:complete len:635 (+) Transcript_7289:182-2086(+)